jgi:hypothetical protein
MKKFSANPGLHEPEIKGLKGEVWGLKTVILAKKTESESMRKTLRWTEKKLLDRQRLTESYSLPRDLSFDHPRCAAIAPLTMPFPPILFISIPEHYSGSSKLRQKHYSCMYNFICLYINRTLTRFT